MFVADKLPSLCNPVMGCSSGLREKAIINFFWKTYKWEFTVVTKEDLKNNKKIFGTFKLNKYE